MLELPQDSPRFMNFLCHFFANCFEGSGVSCSRLLNARKKSVLFRLMDFFVFYNMDLKEKVVFLRLKCRVKMPIFCFIFFYCKIHMKVYNNYTPLLLEKVILIKNEENI